MYKYLYIHTDIYVDTAQRIPLEMSSIENAQISSACVSFYRNVAKDTNENELCFANINAKLHRSGVGSI